MLMKRGLIVMLAGLLLTMMIVLPHGTTQAAPENTPTPTLTPGMGVLIPITPVLYPTSTPKYGGLFNTPTPFDTPEINLTIVAKFNNRENAIDMANGAINWYRAVDDLGVMSILLFGVVLAFAVLVVYQLFKMLTGDE